MNILNKMQEPIFIGSNEQDIKKALEFLKELGINVKISMFNGSYLIYVDENEFYISFVQVREFALKNKLDIKWIDANNNIVPLEYIPVLSFVLAPDKSINEAIEYATEVGYIDVLKEVVGEDIIYYHNDFTKEIFVYRKSDSIDTNNIGQQIMWQELDSLETWAWDLRNVLQQISILNFDGLSLEELVYGEPMYSYFDISFFHYLIERDKSSDCGNYYLDSNVYGQTIFLDYNACKKESKSMSLSGRFHFYNDKTFKSRNPKENVTHSSQTTEIGEFLTRLNMKDNQVEMKTTIKVTRNVNGANLSGTNVRDWMFKGLSNDGGSGVFELAEYYRMLSSGEYLLHYSDNTDSFQIIWFPNCWNLEGGLGEACNSELIDYDWHEFNTSDYEGLKTRFPELFEEVYGILESRKGIENKLIK